MTVEQVNPYIGPRPFRAGDTLYGRNWETQEIRDLLIARRFVLLHSPSGAGKTSLIQAGLLPALEAEDFHVLPPIRVGMDPPPQVLDSGCAFNRFVLSAHISLSDVLAEQNGGLSDITSLCASTLEHLFDRIIGTEEDADQRSVLIFDQFEEIITADPLNLDAKAAFFEQLGAALKNRDRWALFALREDYVASLEPYLHYVPTRLSTHFRLEPLRKAAALEAIKFPVQARGVDYAEGVAEELVDDLLTVPLGKSEFVEPVQLQVVCYDLWDYWQVHAEPGTNMITHEHLAAFGDVEQALANFYDSCIETTTRQAQISERDLRQWFGQQLITPADTRGIVYKGEHTTAGIPNRAVHVLDRLHIIRVEPRAGADWVELTHDGFIEPIQEANHDWEKRLWDRTRRRLKNALLVGASVLGLIALSFGLLAYMRGSDRDQAEQAAAEIQLTATALVELQQTEAARATTEAQQTATAFQIQEATRSAVATAEAQQARSVQLVADAQIALENDDTSLAIALALEAYSLNPAVPGLQRLLADAAYAPGPRLHLSTHTMPTLYSQVALSPDERYAVYAPGQLYQSQVAQMALMPEDTTLAVWDLEEQVIVQRLEGHLLPVVDVAYVNTPDATRILSISQSNVILWDAATGLQQNQYMPLGSNATFTSLATADDGSAALVGGCSRRDSYGTCERGVVLWFSLPDLTLLKSIDIVSSSTVTGVAFEPANTAALVVTGNGELARCDPSALQNNTNCRPTVDLNSALNNTTSGSTLTRTGASALTVDPVNFRALIGMQNGTILVWNITTNRAERTLSEGHTSNIRGVAFSDDGNTALSVSEGGRLVWWNVQSGKPLSQSTYKSVVIWDVAYRRNGTAALTAMGDNSLIVWDLLPGDVKRRITTYDPVQSMALDADSQTVFAGSTTGNLTFWETGSGILTGSVTLGSNAITSLEANPYPGTPTLFAGTAGGRLFVWDENGRDSVYSDLKVVFDTAYSPLAQTLAVAGCQDMQLVTKQCKAGSLQLVDAISKQVLRTFEAHDSALTDHLLTVSSVAISPDGQTVVTASSTGKLAAWDATTGSASLQPQSFAATLTDVVFTPHNNGQAALVGGCLSRDEAAALCRESAVLLVDVQTGVLVRGFAAGSAETTSVAISPDGQTVLAGANDGVIRRWDTESGREIFRYESHTGAVIGLVFVPMSNEFISAASDGQLIQWRIDAFSELLTWTERNRHLTELTCEEQIAFGITPTSECQSAALMLITPTAPAEDLPTSEASADTGPADTPAPPAATRTVTPTPVPITIQKGETQQVTGISAASYWTFDGMAGDVLSVALTSDTGTMAGTVILYSPAQNEIVAVSETQASGSMVVTNIILPETGTYTLVTQQLNPKAPDYAVTLTDLKLTTATPRPSPTPPREAPVQQQAY